MRTLKTVLAAALVFGTASMALADDGTDTRLDTSRTGAAVQSQQFNTRNVALPYQQGPAYQGQGYQGQSYQGTSYQDQGVIDRAGANADNGGN